MYYQAALRAWLKFTILLYKVVMGDSSAFLDIACRLGADKPADAARCLQAIDEFSCHRDLVEGLWQRLSELLPGSGETDRFLSNLARFLEASRSRQSWLTLFEREPEALKTLVQLFSTSQYMAEILIADPEVFDLLRMTGGQPVAPGVLQDEIMAEVLATGDLRGVMRILRDYRHRETLRIAYGDFVLEQPLEIVTEQLTHLTESILQAAVVAARRDVDERRSPPTHTDGRPVEMCVLALGKLGGAELNYSSDIDLVFIYETIAERRGPATTALKESQVEEYFQRVGQLVIKLLSESIDRGIAYRVDMRLRPYGGQGPLVVSYDRALKYYDTAGRTWERQAFVKARPVAGDVALGAALIRELQTWIYRRYLMRVDITGLAALKRRLERRAQATGDNHRNVKLGRGGIRDIETTIQFLQLLHGGDEPGVRSTGTLTAIAQLRKAGCLTGDEQIGLEDSYRFLRRVEHFLQIMYDRKTHTLPSDEAEFSRLAKRIGYRDSQGGSAGDELRNRIAQITERNHKILDHLLHEAFDADVSVAAETDLILDPEPSPEIITETLSPFGFSDCHAAYRHLQTLAVESIPFLSTRRCRHFLAAIAPKLLAAIAATPNPDATLVSLANVSDSLGGKAGLWELFSANQASLELCVRLCASSPYLTSILTSNPGMIDELLDSLMLERLPTHEELALALAELCRGAVDISPILQSFKNSMHLRVGVRDILGKSSIAQTHAALSAIAEVCLEQVIHHEFHRLVHQLGMPTREPTLGGTEAAEFVVLAVGKLGGREPNYHSDLDVIFLFDVEGHTRSLVPNRRFESTTNRHFFNQLCQRIIQAATRVTGSGRLFDLDVRLRPLGRSGELAITFEDLQRYFADSGGQVWERQALCNARPIWGSSSIQNAAMECVHQVLTASPWTPAWAEQILGHRLHLQKGSNPLNLKRGEGGTMDVEFVVQLLQLVHAQAHPAVLVPGTLPALKRIAEAGLIESQIADELRISYEFLRSVESGIRLMNMTARHELPSQAAELRRLAFLMTKPNSTEYWDGPALVRRCEVARQHCRAVLQSVFEAYMPESALPASAEQSAENGAGLVQ